MSFFNVYCVVFLPHMLKKLLLLWNFIFRVPVIRLAYFAQNCKKNTWNRLFSMVTFIQMQACYHNIFSFRYIGTSGLHRSALVVFQTNILPGPLAVVYGNVLTHRLGEGCKFKFNAGAHYNVKVKVKLKVNLKVKLKVND